MLLLAAGIGLVAVVTTWVIDARAHRHAVLPNVAVADKRVRGMKAAELHALVHDIAARFAQSTVDVRATAGGDAFQASVPDLGVTVNEGRTVGKVLAAGRSGSLLRRLWDWAHSFLSPVKVPVAIDVDRQKLAGVVAQRDKGRVPPVEPTIAVKDGHLDGVPGKNGRGIDPAKLADALARTQPASGTLVVTMDVTSVPPEFTQADADRVAAEGEKLAVAGLQVASGDHSAPIPADSLRAWLGGSASDTGLRLTMKRNDAVLDGLAKLLPDAGVKPTDAGFTVSDGKVSITPSKTGTACCTPAAFDALDAALVDPALRSAPVQLPLKTLEPSRNEEAARQLGIVEQVSTFTTPHNAGEPRVTNIHRMADTVRGTVIPPGGTFSLNGIVGQRTKDKGYVEAPVIAGDYTFDTDVGGGVSQFSTTMFNAAFFAGLDITEYMMHGLYISRYPYGREATLSWPGPDLKVRNSTPYGVLVWPTYTGSSITVTLYSTKYVTGAQTGQTKDERPSVAPKAPGTTGSPDGSAAPPADPGPCIAVTTERTRTYVDGHTVVDHFSGLYAPAEGWSCATR